MTGAFGVSWANYLLDGLQVDAALAAWCFDAFE
jgi:hypothetical protein